MARAGRKTDVPLREEQALDVLLGAKPATELTKHGKKAPKPENPGKGVRYLFSSFATYGETVIKGIAGVVSANGTAGDPKAYAEKVAHQFFPNILPYEVGTPAVFGFAEWNGRSLTDNAPDVVFSVAANTPVRLGIGKESVTAKPSTTFPYVPVAS